MKRWLCAAAGLLIAGSSATAHRLDEYLQGTILSVDKNRMDAQIVLTPGVAVFPTVIADIDTNGDGTISDIEQRAYAAKVLSDLSIAIDGEPLKPRLYSMRFPPIDDMKEGRGEIQLQFDAALPRGGGNRKLTLENYHESRIAVYQVNSLVPKDPDIRIIAQKRNYTQSSYELDFTQSGATKDNRLTKLAATLALMIVSFLAIAWKIRERQLSIGSSRI
jgi:hypothetical protein